MKEELIALYQENLNSFIDVIESFPDDDLAGPFLMSPSDFYLKQKNKLLIIGQETNGWSYNYKDVIAQMNTYAEFNVGIDYYSSPFWNITRKLEAALNNEPYTCAWSNLSKFDLEQSRPYGKYLEKISKLDPIIKDEIRIINPDVCHFFTGPSFDYRLVEIFPGIIFEQIGNWNVRQFCKLIHTNLPSNSYRSYHPKALRIRKLEFKFIEFFNNLKSLN